MKSLYPWLLALMLFGLSRLACGQVLLDDFNRPNDATVGNGWTEISTRIISNQSRIQNQALRIASDDASADFVFRNVSARYNTVFRANANVLTWAINMRQTLVNPNGFNSTSNLATTNGMAFVLGVNNLFLAGSPNGYAVVLGQPGKPDPIRLVRINGQIGNNALFSMITGGDYSNEFLSIRVTYNPANEQWSLYVEASPIAYPRTDPRQTSNLIGTAVDNTYTGQSLNNLGLDWHHSNSPGDYATFDDIYIPTNEPQQYTWNVASGNWSNPQSWTPTRNTPRSNDILLFDGSVRSPVSAILNFPSPQTIGQLRFINGVQAIFSTAQDRALNLVNTVAGDDFAIETGSSLTVTNSAPNADLQINLPAGANGRVAGALTFRGENLGANHRLTAAEAVTGLTTGIRFVNGSSFSAGSNFIGNAFGSAVSNSVRFESGATYVSGAGSDPFALPAPAAVTVFQTGSLYRHQQTTLSPGLAGRTYANFDLALPTAVGVMDIVQGGNAAQMDALTISRGIFRFSLTNGTAQSLSLRNDLTVLPEGTFDYNPATPGALSTLRLNGSTSQSVGGGGNIVIGRQAVLEINNSTGILLQQDMEVAGTLRMQNGLLQSGTNTIGLGPEAILTESETSRVLGRVRSSRALAQGSSQDFGGMGLEIQANGTAPGLTTITRFTGPDAIRTSSDGNQSIARYFRIEPTTNADLDAQMTFRYFDTEVVGEDLGLLLFRSVDNGIVWTDEQGTLDPAANTLTRSGLFSLSGDWTAADANKPLPVTLLSFSGRREGNGVLLEWSTTAEVDNARFEIQRSTDLKAFEKIGLVAANEAQLNLHHYTFRDENRQQAGYYRLKQLDHYGTYQLSKPIYVEGNTSFAHSSLLVYPNPTEGHLYLSLPDESLAQASLFSSHGLSLFTLSALPDVLHEQLSQTLSQLPAGFYLLQIRQSGQVYHNKLEKR
jgi:hypothetical protein